MNETLALAGLSDFTPEARQEVAQELEELTYRLRNEAVSANGPDDQVKQYVLHTAANEIYDLVREAKGMIRRDVTISPISTKREVGDIWKEGPCEWKLQMRKGRATFKTYKAAFHVKEGFNL